MTSLGRHVSPVVDDARLERQVAAVTRKLGAKPARPLRIVVSLAAVSVVVFAGVAWRARVAPLPVAPATLGAGTTVEASAGGEILTLADGSRVVLDARSKLTVTTVEPSVVRVTLERGGAELEVVHAEGKRFVVEARGYEIRVLGTRFSVRLRGEGAGAALEVKVTRGRVRVTRAGQSEEDLRVLGAGETWSTRLDAPSPAPEATPPAEPAPTAAPAEPAPSASRAGESARELLARAQAFRAADDTRSAARLFDTLRSQHRSDPRAGLAAFELGRLRLDRLGDPSGAAEAFRDALALSPAAPFREDAEARLVEAYEAAGAHARCGDAREHYLARYPGGVHREQIAARCRD